jgi:hypothetical protein
VGDDGGCRRVTVMRQAHAGVVGVRVDDAAVKDLGERRLSGRRG